MVSPQQPGKVPDYVTVPTHVGEQHPAASVKRRPLSQYGSAESLARVFSRHGEEIAPEQFEQADASPEELRRFNPELQTPRRPRRRMPAEPVLEAGPETRELSAGD
jgi:hypothetical protein